MWPIWCLPLGRASPDTHIPCLKDLAHSLHQQLFWPFCTKCYAALSSERKHYFSFVGSCSLTSLVHGECPEVQRKLLVQHSMNSTMPCPGMCVNKGTGGHRGQERWLRPQLAARHDQALLTPHPRPLTLLLTFWACPETQRCPREQERTSPRGDGRLGNQQWLQSGQAPPETVCPKWTLL